MKNSLLLSVDLIQNENIFIKDETHDRALIVIIMSKQIPHIFVPKDWVWLGYFPKIYKMCKNHVYTVVVWSQGVLVVAPLHQVMTGSDQTLAADQSGNCHKGVCH